MRRIHPIVLVAIVGVVVLVILLIPQETVAPVIGSSESSFSDAVQISEPDPEDLFLVTNVVDGDTIDTKDFEGKTERVRFIGIDTPETVDERKTVQCFGHESSERLRELLEGKSVELSTKPDEDRDDYDRLLRYVLLRGEDVGATMISEGFARSLCHPFPHPKCDEYAALEKSARAEKKGRWQACRK